MKGRRAVRKSGQTLALILDRCLKRSLQLEDDLQPPLVWISANEVVPSAGRPSPPASLAACDATLEWNSSAPTSTISSQPVQRQRQGSGVRTRTRSMVREGMALTLSSEASMRKGRVKSRGLISRRKILLMLSRSFGRTACGIRFRSGSQWSGQVRSVVISGPF